MKERFQILGWHLNQLNNETNQNGWRRAEASYLSNLVQKRLEYLQNPPDCKTARKLVCDLKQGVFDCETKF
jgi:glycoprotein 6-alpha-L-fucosyltransferase